MQINCGVMASILVVQYMTEEYFIDDPASVYSNLQIDL